MADFSLLHLIYSFLLSALFLLRFYDQQRPIFIPKTLETWQFVKRFSCSVISESEPTHTKPEVGYFYRISLYIISPSKKSLQNQNLLSILIKNAFKWKYERPKLHNMCYIIPLSNCFINQPIFVELWRKRVQLNWWSKMPSPELWDYFNEH